MNIAESFANYMQNDLSIATLGQDLYISAGPDSDRVPDSIWWIVASGGAKDVSLQSGEVTKRYQLDVYFRHRDAEVVYNRLQALEEQLNCPGCVQLDGFDIISVEAITFPVDQDIDNEDRSVGLLQASILTYKEC